MCLLAFQVAAFIPNLAPEQAESFVQELGFIPMAPTWYGAMTYAFLHAGLLHFLGNALYLWVFGSHVEDTMGPFWFFLLYIISHFTALISHVAFESVIAPEVLGMPIVGASGAVSGLLGLFAVRFWRTPVKIFYFFLIIIRPVWGTFTLKGSIVLGIWFLLQVLDASLAGASPVAYFAHIGPFVFGVGLGLFQAMEEEGTHESLLEESKKLVETGKSNRAVPMLQQVLKKEPENSEALLAMARACKNNRRLADAGSYYQEALEQFLKAGDLKTGTKAYLEARDLNIPFHAVQLFKIAQALESENNFAEAMSLYGKILGGGTGEDKESALFHQCRILLYKLLEGERALFNLKRFLEEFPQSPFVQQAEEMLVAARDLITQGRRT